MAGCRFCSPQSDSNEFDCQCANQFKHLINGIKYISEIRTALLFMFLKGFVKFNFVFFKETILVLWYNRIYTHTIPEIGTNRQI